MSENEYTPREHEWGVSMGRAAAAEQPDWVVDGLIERGDQWMIAGAPKAGKSLLATQLALAASEGGTFLDWRCSRPQKVLYMDFELKHRVFWQRVLDMYHGNEQAMLRNANFLRCGDFKTIDVLDVVERKRIADMIDQVAPDLIVWDVLARMHSADENDNGMMKAVMMGIRMLSGSAAHIVVHHARKPPSGAEGVNLGALSMRGASSIHGEADGVMSLAVRDGQGARYSLQFSARAVQAPDEMLLSRNDDSLTYQEAAGSEQERIREVLQAAMKGQGVILSQELEEHICAAFDVKSRRAKDYLRQCREWGWLELERRQDKRYQYVLTDGAPILKSVK